MVAVAAVAVSAVGVAVAADSASTAHDDQQAALENQKSVEEKQYDLAKHQQDIADQQYNRYKTTYAPLEDEMVNEARDYGSNANRERAATTAGGDVTASFSSLRDKLNSTPGLDPSSAHYLDTMSRLGVQEAGSKAAAETGARDRVDQVGAAKMSDAVSLGKGLPGTSAAILAGSGASLNGAAATASDIGRSSSSMLASANQGLGGSWSALGKSVANPTFGTTMGNWFSGDSQSLNPSASASNYGMGDMYIPTDNASFGGSIAGP